MLTLHQGEMWQLDLPDTVSKVTSIRGDQVDVAVDGNIVQLKAAQNSGWGQLTIRLTNGDALQFVYNLASANGKLIQRVVINYPSDTAPMLASQEAPTAPPAAPNPDLPLAKIGDAGPAATRPPQPGEQVQAGPQPAPSWLSFAFTGGTRSGQSMTLNYSLTNKGQDALLFNPRGVSMRAGTSNVPVSYLGDQNTPIRVNAGQTVFGSLVIDTSASKMGAPVTWSWIGSTLDRQKQYDIGGPLALVLSGVGNDH
ncbi:hypothetical protein Dxin01_00764 [Deinococcus xinjiangensis]|uniref:Uncharacterized protein n=2 Tax=Deinococcus xinjiangensis TaxID=457454 RepID=A0ABP9VAI5_9DEIO